MKKLVSVIILSLFMLLLFTGCANNQSRPSRPDDEYVSSPETVRDRTPRPRPDRTPELTPTPEITNPTSLNAKETLELYFTSIYNNEIDIALSLICDDSLYVYGYTKDFFHDHYTAFNFNNNYEFIDILLQNVYSLDDYEGYKTTVKVLENGVENTIDEGIHYVGQRNGVYKIIKFGAISRTEMPAQNTPDALLYMYITYIIQLIDGYAIVVETVNNTDFDFQIGWVTPGDAILSTDIGTYYNTFNVGSKIEANRRYTDTFVFNNARGQILNLSITNVTRLSATGLASPGDAGETFIVYQSN